MTGQGSVPNKRFIYFEVEWLTRLSRNNFQYWIQVIWVNGSTVLLGISWTCVLYSKTGSLVPIERSMLTVSDIYREVY